MSSLEHFVQFYESDEYIVNSVAEYLLHGFKSGNVCIIAATPEHRRDIDRVLGLFSRELENARAEGRFIELDAAETLGKFMVDGMPDAERFDAVIGDLVREAQSAGRAVRIFGEMVAVLWQEGNPRAAIRLEELWNSLDTEAPFTLFCAYPTGAFASVDDVEGLHEVCGHHTRVIPDETYTELSTVEERLRLIVSLQQKAKRLDAMEQSAAD